MTHAISRNLTKSNPEFVRGDGIYLFDHDGRRYIDGSSGSSLVCNIGHGVREVAEVMTPQAELLTYNPTHCSYSSAYVDMCEKVSELAPQGLDHVFAVNSGSEATETALKFARQYQVTRKKESKYEIISRWQSYHGNTIGGLSCSGHTFRRRKHTPNLKRYHHIPPAFCYRCHFEKTYPQCELKCARVLENAILTAGTAPSGAHMQPWHFVVVKDKKVKTQIREAAEVEERALYGHSAAEEWLRALEPLGTDANKPFLEKAPALIAVFLKKFTIDENGKKCRNYYTTESVGIATGLLIASLHKAGCRSRGRG